MKSVVEYFQEMYGFTIQQTHLPCLQVGNQKKANYLPMEVGSSVGPSWVYFSFSFAWLLNVVCMLLMLQACKIVEGQRYTKRLNERQITALLRVTCQRPRDREKDILQVLVTFWYCLFLKLLNRVILQTLQVMFCGLDMIMDHFRITWLSYSGKEGCFELLDPSCHPPLIVKTWKF